MSDRTGIMFDSWIDSNLDPKDYLIECQDHECQWGILEQVLEDRRELEETIEKLLVVANEYERATINSRGIIQRLIEVCDSNDLIQSTEALTTFIDDDINELENEIMHVQEEIFDFQEEFKLEENKIELQYFEAVSYEDDDMRRFGMVIHGKRDQFKDKMFIENEERKVDVDKISTQTYGLIDKWETLENVVEEHRYLRCYRLCGLDEEPEHGLDRSNDEVDYSITAAQHIEDGSHSTRKSKYISASKDSEVCLFYASKAIYERRMDRSDLQIIVMHLDLVDGFVFDLEDNATRERVLEIEYKSTAYNYGVKLQEVLISRPVASKEIDQFYRVKIPHDIPRASSFNDFSTQLRIQRLDKIARLNEEV